MSITSSNGKPYQLLAGEKIDEPLQPIREFFGSDLTLEFREPIDTRERFFGLREKE